jgi:hypothetical protein
MSLFYLYRFKFAVKLQIILFENAIIGHFAIRAVLALLLGNPLGLLFFRLRQACVLPPPRPQSPSPSLFM